MVIQIVVSVVCVALLIGIALYYRSYSARLKSGLGKSNGSVKQARPAAKKENPMDYAKNMSKQYKDK